MSSSSGDFVPLNPWPGASPLDPTEASSQTILQARSTTLAQILPSYIRVGRGHTDTPGYMATPLFWINLTSVFFQQAIYF